MLKFESDQSAIDIPRFGGVFFCLKCLKVHSVAKLQQFFWVFCDESTPFVDKYDNKNNAIEFLKPSSLGAERLSIRYTKHCSICFSCP